MSQAFSAAAAAGHQMLRHKRFQQLQLQATRCYVPKLPNTARKAISQFQLQAAKHCAQSYFSSGRLPNTARKAISAVPAAGCQTLRAKLFQQFQLQAAKHCAQSYFSSSSCRLPNTARKPISAVAGRQTLRAKLFQQFQLQAAKHCAQSYFSSLKLPNTREK
jgi:hypothetical protein